MFAAMAAQSDLVASRLRWGKYSFAYRNRLLNGGRALQAFLQSKDMSWDLIEKGRSSQVDGILESFVRQMHDTDGKSSLLVAKHAVLYVQILRPRLRKTLKSSWSAIRAWEELRPSGYRAPLPLTLLAALLCEARKLGHTAKDTKRGLLWFQFAGLLTIGFFGLLRPSEMYNLCREDVTIPNTMSLGSDFAVVLIRQPKNARQMGPQQFAQVHHPDAINWLTWMIHAGEKSHGTLWPSSPGRFRNIFKVLCSRIGIGNMKLSPASLRAGGATWMLDEQVEIPRIRFYGRWSNLRSLEHYLQVARAQQIALNIRPLAVTSIKKLLQKYSFMLALPEFFAAQIPGELLVTTEIISIRSDDHVVAAIRSWGQLAKTVQTNHSGRRTIEGRAISGRSLGRPSESSKGIQR